MVIGGCKLVPDNWAQQHTYADLFTRQSFVFLSSQSEQMSEVHKRESGESTRAMGSKE